MNIEDLEWRWNYGK